MSLRENNQADAAEPTGDLLRRAVYLAVGIALLVTLWALTKGDDRDLWSETSVVAVARLARAT